MDATKRSHFVLFRIRPHESVFKRKRSCFAPFSKRFTSTLIVFVSFSPVHTTTPYPFWKRFYTLSAHAEMNSTHTHFNISAREIAAILDSVRSICPPFWILTAEWSGARSYLFSWRHRIQIVPFSPSTLENSVQKASFSNRSTLESVFEWFRFRWSFSAL